jgi:hypothetical protein
VDSVDELLKHQVVTSEGLIHPAHSTIAAATSPRKDEERKESVTSASKGADLYCYPRSGPARIVDAERSG